MSLDILAALEAAPAGRTGEACKIQRFLDGIPDDSPGKPTLEATLTTRDESSPDYRTLEQLAAILARLGCRTSPTYVGAHRAGRCRCHL